MAHYIPERVQLASQLEEVFLEFIHVVDPSTGTRLISYECLKTICTQVRHILNKKLRVCLPFCFAIMFILGMVAASYTECTEASVLPNSKDQQLVMGLPVDAKVPAWHMYAHRSFQF